MCGPSARCVSLVLPVLPTLLLPSHPHRCWGEAWMNSIICCRSSMPPSSTSPVCVCARVRVCAHSVCLILIVCFLDEILAQFPTTKKEDKEKSGKSAPSSGCVLFSSSSIKCLLVNLEHKKTHGCLMQGVWKSSSLEWKCGCLYPPLTDFPLQSYVSHLACDVHFSLGVNGVSQQIPVYEHQLVCY